MENKKKMQNENVRAIVFIIYPKCPFVKTPA